MTTSARAVGLADASAINRIEFAERGASFVVAVGIVRELELDATALLRQLP